jgi:aminocarboxymuconate-semialdehyde decarboxylase
MRHDGRSSKSIGFPGLKICAAHAGGYLPSYAARSNQCCVTFPERCTKTLKKKPTEYLRQLYYDSMVFTPEGLRHLIAEVGASQCRVFRDNDLGRCCRSHGLA